MAMILRLTDGTTTVTLSGNGSTILGCTYAPQTPGAEVSRLAQAVKDGQPISRIVRANVTEAAEVILSGSVSQIEGVEDSINQLLGAALHRQRTGNGPRVYVEYAKTGSTEVHRSELFYGRTLRDEAPERRRFASSSNVVAVGLSWERAFCWEGQEVQLTNGSTIYNHDDSGQDNFWTVTAGNVTGDLPAPVRLVLTNTAGASRAFRRFYLASAWDGYDYTHILEGENRISGYGTATADASCSNGNFNRQTVSTTAEVHWTLSSTLLGKTKGRWFRLLARVYRPGVGLYVKPEIRDTNGLVTLWAGEEVRLTGGALWQVMDLGRVPLPPGGYSTSYTGLRLVLVCRSAASVNLDIDFIQLSSTDSWLDLEQLGYDIANNGTITVDCISDLYHAGGQPIYVPSGGPLMVWPNANNRFYLLEHEGTNCLVDNSFTVSMWYRPRRVAL